MGNSLKLEIIVDDKGTPIVRQFGSQATQTLDQVAAAGQRLEAGFAKTRAGVSAGVASALYIFERAKAAVGVAWNMAEASAGYMEQMQLLDGLARRYNTTADAIVGRIREISESMISMATAAEVSTSALAKGLSAEQMQNLSAAAVTLSDVMGTTADEAFRRLAGALETGKEKTVKLAVGMIDLEQRYGEQAKLMSEAEKQQALYNMVVEKAAEIQKRAGGETKSLSDKMETLKTTLADVKLELGTGIIRSAAGATGAFQSMSAASLSASAGIWKIIEAKQILQTYVSWGEAEKIHAEAASYAAQQAASDWKQSINLASKAQDNFSLMTASIEELIKAQKALNQAKDEEQKNQRRLQEANQLVIDGWKREMDRRISVLTEWEKESLKVGRSTSEAELAELDRRYSHFAEFVQDEAKLAQWLEDEKKAILLRASQEQISLWEELYSATRNEQYANASIDAMKQILDAEEEKWRTILGNDDDAHRLRIKREEEYVARIKGLINEVTESQVEAAAEADHSCFQKFMFRPAGSLADESSASALNPGAVTGGGTVDVVYGRTFINDRSGAQAYQRQMEEMNRTLKQVAENTAKTAAAAAEEAAREAQRALEEKQGLLENAYGRYEAFVRTRTRAPWGQADYESEFGRLASSFGSSQYFEESVNLLGEMLDVIQELDTIARQQLDQQKQQAASLQSGSGSVSDWLMDLSQGSLAPVQSAAEWATRFEEIKAQAMADEAKISDFLSYAQRYLEFEKAYGTSGSYAAAYGSITDSVQGLGDWMDLAARLSELGLGDSLGDISALITAFGNLGVSIGDLKSAADTAAGAGLSELAATLGQSLPSAAGTASSLTGTLANSLQNTETPFGNVTDALNTMGENVQSRLQDVSAFFTTLAERMGLTFNEDATGTAIGILTKTEYVKATPQVVSVVPATPYIGERRYMEPIFPGASTMREVFIPAQQATYKVIYDDGSFTMRGKGGLTDGLSIAGEIGPEWVVPTYEPERSQFLRDVGADPAAIARAVAPMFNGSRAESSGRQIIIEIQNKMVVDGREIARAVAKQIPINSDLISSIRRIA